MQLVIRMIKNTHRHPVNRALHFIGAPFYAIGASMTIGHFAGMQADFAAGVLMWVGAVAMFVAGHKIENNIGSMTPVLLLRLVSRKASSYSIAQRIHFMRG